MAIVAKLYTPSQRSFTRMPAAAVPHDGGRVKLRM